MNDGAYLYIAVVIRNEDYKPSEFGIQGDVLSVFFDNDHNGDIFFPNTVQGDDLMQAQIGFAPQDMFRFGGNLSYQYDDQFGGANNVLAGISHTNPVPGAIGDYTYEFRKPLNSGDALDFSLAPGNTVGFFVYFVDTPLGDNGGAQSSWPGPDECLVFESPTPCVGADIRIASPVLPIAIDIKPGGFPNSINPRNRGVIPVAILSSPTFDAPSAVDRTSLTFGRTGDEQSLGFCSPTPQDANGDPLPDLICHFETDQTGFQPGDTKGTLKGKTVGNLPFIGIDSVRIL